MIKINSDGLQAIKMKVDTVGYEKEEIPVLPSEVIERLLIANRFDYFKVSSNGVRIYYRKIDVVKEGKNTKTIETYYDADDVDTVLLGKPMERRDIGYTKYCTMRAIATKDFGSRPVYKFIDLLHIQSVIQEEYYADDLLASEESIRLMEIILDFIEELHEETLEIKVK